LETRKETIIGLQNTMSEKGTSDVLLKFLQRIRNQLNNYFHDRDLVDESAKSFEEAMGELERDSEQLDMVQDMIREVIKGKFGVELLERSREVGFLLQDLVHLRRSAGSLVADGLVADDVNIRKFLQDANPLTCPSTAGLRPDVPGKASGTSTPMRLGMGNALTDG